MNVIIGVEHRFLRTPDGAVWSPILFSHNYLQLYLEVFNEVRIVARIADVASAAPDWYRSDGTGVSFVAVPNYRGPWQYATQLYQVQRVIRNAVIPSDAIILSNGQISRSISGAFNLHRRPYGLRVTGDPRQVFEAVKHPLSPFMRWWAPRHLRQLCTHACAVAYVTEHSLQRIYPPGKQAYTTHFTSNGLASTDFAPRSYAPVPGKDRFVLTIVGSLAQLYKAPDILIDAVAECVHAGLDLQLNIVGDGMYRAALEQHVTDRNLRDRVHFWGQLPSGQAVQAQLDQSDLFILPSRTEGLPKALIEAMARGLPCIGSTAGGIPELLPPEDMVPPGNVPALALKIHEILTNPYRMAHMAARNLAKARNYSEEAISKRRNEFHRRIRTQTEDWLRQAARTRNYV